MQEKSADRIILLTAAHDTLEVRQRNGGMGMKDRERFPYIKPYCDLMGSFAYYVNDQYAAAKRMNAPRDVFAVSERDGTFCRLSECDEHRIARLENHSNVKLADVMDNAA